MNAMPLAQGQVDVWDKLPVDFYSTEFIET